jgi:LPPG:FO 2-phospho-L-lactate transferase
MSALTDHVVVLAGGVGGAKLVVGLAQRLSPEALTVIANTGDDFEHLGLYICPDLDTIMYSLASLANPETGWGIDGDTFRAMDVVSRVGGPDWFRLGDSDLGLNLMRTAWLQAGKSLTQVTADLCAKLEIQHRVIPMANQPVRTMLNTDNGTLGFQEYFVRDRWQPVVHSLHYQGAAEADSGAVIQAITHAGLVVFAPSNPFLSIDPVLALSGVRQAIRESSAMCIAVSPIVGGAAIKGPAAKLMGELGLEVSAVGIARHYEDLLDGIILDTVDSELAPAIHAHNIQTVVTSTMMHTRLDKVQLAATLLDWVK